MSHGSLFSLRFLEFDLKLLYRFQGQSAGIVVAAKWLSNMNPKLIFKE